MEIVVSFRLKTFTFHYVSISTCYLPPQRERVYYLHSTMYLFQRQKAHRTYPRQHIYIPLCIYFNKIIFMKYLWIYQFTFHYVSISTTMVKDIFGFLPDLHSTMYLFQLKENILIIKVVIIYIPLCIYFNELQM